MIYHIYRERSERRLEGAQILNHITAEVPVFKEGNTYIHENKVYEIIAVTSLNFSGLLAHMYIWKYDEETTKAFIELGIISS